MIRVDTQWHYHGLQVVRLENKLICVDVLPELGAKIYNFIHRPSNRNLLWHNPRVPPARQHFGAVFDDVWSGGWDELIPNDLPAPADNGEMLPDHGEVWSQATEWEVVKREETEAAVRFVNHGRVLPTIFEKTVFLRAGESFCTVRYRFTNLGPRPIDFLWNIHPALAISPATHLDVPARRGIVDPWHAVQFEAGNEYDWPYVVDRAGNRVDLRKVPALESATADHHYLVDLQRGWYAATDAEAQIGFGLVFPTKVFPHLWLFRALGGWRGLYTLILEPSTGYPNDLATARKIGHCGHLDPGDSIEAEVKAVAYSGLKAVGNIESDAAVSPG
jgi:hypothetical protein